MKKRLACLMMAWPLAATAGVRIRASVPTLDFWGLIGLGVVIGAVTYLIRFRRK